MRAPVRVLSSCQSDVSKMTVTSATPEPPLAFWGNVLSVYTYRRVHGRHDG
jgi:hypothetical protein